MWNRDKYVYILKRIVNDGKLGDIEIKNKTVLYKLIGDKIHISAEAVRSWTNRESNGPGSEELREELEEVLGLMPGALYRGNLAREEKELPEVVVSDFAKEKIMECYYLMKDYLHGEDFFNPDTFAEMEYGIRKRKIAIPLEIYKKIETYVDEHLASLVYDVEGRFFESYSENYWEEVRVNKFQPKSEEAKGSFWGNFYSVLYDLEQELERFGMEELGKYLV